MSGATTASERYANAMKLSDQSSVYRRAHSDHPCTWLFLGDSITHGALHTWGSRDYVERFDEAIRWGLGRRGDVVINTAYSGMNIKSVSDELDHRCLRFPADVVSVTVGMNDCNAAATGVEAFTETYQRVIDRLRQETTAAIFLQTQNTIDVANSPGRAALPEYMQAVRDMATANDLPVCDHYAVWDRYSGTAGKQIFYLLNDPVHPGAEGHLLMARTLVGWLGYDNASAGLPHFTPLDDFDPVIDA